MTKLIIMTTFLVAAVAFGKNKIKDFSYDRIPQSQLPSTTEHVDKEVLESSLKSPVKNRFKDRLPDDRGRWEEDVILPPFYDQD